MIGSLNKDQCERILLASMIGRIGCYAEGKSYVVPIAYVLDKGYIYAHSKEGLKIEMMRKHPEVCFQVDQIDNMANWRSVVFWGKFEELKSSAQREAALEILTKGLDAFTISDSVKPPKSTGDMNPHKEKMPVFYRISIREISGRFEKQED